MALRDASARALIKLGTKVEVAVQPQTESPKKQTEKSASSTKAFLTFLLMDGIERESAKRGGEQ